MIATVRRFGVGNRCERITGRSAKRKHRITETQYLQVTEDHGAVRAAKATGKS